MSAQELSYGEIQLRVDGSELTSRTHLFESITNIHTSLMESAHITWE